jgi:hypothetical protein
MRVPASCGIGGGTKALPRGLNRLFGVFVRTASASDAVDRNDNVAILSGGTFETLRILRLVVGNGSGRTRFAGRSLNVCDLLRKSPAALDNPDNAPVTASSELGENMFPELVVAVESEVALNGTVM